MARGKQKAVAAPEVVTAESRYAALEGERSPYLMRARDAAKLTIPALVPPDGFHSGSVELYKPYQSVGARGINHLAAKLMLALFPPGSSFFRFRLDDYLLDELEQQDDADGTGKQDFDSALVRIEKAVTNRMEQKGARTDLFEALKQLLVAGNVLLEIQRDGRIRLHYLHSYVVKRDRSGNVLEIVVKEVLHRSTVPEAVRVALIAAEAQEAVASGAPETKDVDLYTRVWRDGRRWRVQQEVKGIVIPGTEGTYPLEKTAWLPLRFTKVHGEDYGRGFADEYMGDLSSLEAIRQGIVQFTGAASKILLFVNESGTTSKRKIEQAPSGAILDGSAKDVTILQLEKYADFQVAQTVAGEIEQNLKEAFLLHSAVQRNAERVTAEEVRYIAGELEQALGGVYSILAQELQLPLVIRLMAVMQRARELPTLPDDTVSPQIVTGLDGLGRSSDLNKLDIFIAGIAQQFGPEAVSRYVDVGAYLTRRANALGVDVQGIIRSAEEIAAQDQAAAQQSMMEKAVAPGAALVGKAMDVASNEQPTGA